ncbi:MAG: efflux RND transporter permease subunit [Desulfarculaceae bacterium]
MKLPGFSVERPVFAIMVAMMVVLVGLVSLSRLQIDLLPNIELPTVTVRTNYEGASPEVMEKLVTQIVEEIVATVPGVLEITSQSSRGRSRVRVVFDWGTDINAAALDVRGKLEDELSELPEGVERPQVHKFDVNSFPVVLLGVSSTLSPVELTEFIEDQLRYRLARLPGVAQVDLWGGFNREVRVELDPDRLRALGLPLNQVLDAIKNANLDLPTGEIEQGRLRVTLRAPAEFKSLKEIRDTVVAVRQGAPVTLAEVAQVADTYEKLERIVRVNKNRGVRVAVRKQAASNTVEVSRAILDEIEKINQQYPQINIVPVINQGNFIELSIRNVARSVLYGGGLAILVLLFFLRSIRGTVVISLGMPISIIATFALMYFSGFTLNLMTLGGLALGVGMMVDSSVVVLENTYYRCRVGCEAPEIAAVNGANEVGKAIVASTITTLVIFLPLAFVKGVAGLLFGELAYTVIFALVCALLVALSLVPMLASRLLRAESNAGSGQVARLSQKAGEFFTALETSYRRLLTAALQRRGITVAAAATAVAASLSLAPFIGSEFLPPSDEGEVRVVGEMETGTKLGLVNRQTKIMESIVFPAVPEIVSSVTTVGAWGRRAEAASHGELQLTLTNSSQRSRSNTEIAADLRRRLSDKIPGMKIRTRAPQGQFLLERLLGGDEGLQVEIRGYDLNTLQALAKQVADEIENIPGVTDTDTSLKEGVPQLEFDLDRGKIADLGLTVRGVVQALETAMAGSKAGEYRVGGNAYRIWVKLARAEERSPEDILGLTLTTRSGEQVALANILTTKSGRGPLLIDRKDQQRVVTVSANLAGRDMGSVAGDVRKVLQRLPRPAGYELVVAGNLEEQEKAFGELLISLLLALALVYMVLACQYESFRDPLVVMFSVPVASVGVLLMLFFTDTTFNLQSYIGCIMLGGIVVNNAILLVDTAGRLHREGMPAKQAAAEAGGRRLRPILMTSLTTILALTPLALGIGEGADAQAPLARAVVGGLAGSSVITLVLIPAIYSLFHPDKEGNPA